MSTKLLALVDALGNMVRFVLLPGQRGETLGVEELLRDVRAGAFIADKAYDADWLRALLKRHGMEAVIPARSNRNHPAAHDEEKYRWRHLIENYSQKLKEFKRIAMRSDKTDESFKAMICIAATVINLK